MTHFYWTGYCVFCMHKSKAGSECTVLELLQQSLGKEAELDYLFLINSLFSTNNGESIKALGS